MSETPPTVYIVDDDPAIRKSLFRLLSSAGYCCICHESAEAFLDEYKPGEPGCVLIDLDLPGIDGFGVQESLSSMEIGPPAIFLTGTGDIPASVRAMKAGAVDFLTKPVDASTLLSAVEEALAFDDATRTAISTSDDLRVRLETLTPRERQVLDRVVLGRQNKQIAAELGTAVKTIKVHRARMMRKMQMPSLAELVRAMVELDAESRSG
ncbi:response regulator transcription factor [Microbaculum sp. FT89]|uniref:response regulator transcription factor n=1 Tax=Microbaculum sp. FT89 TaxID=3447298 RepID=UPI003F52E18C